MRGRVSGMELAQVAAAPMIGDFEAGLVNLKAAAEK